MSKSVISGLAAVAVLVIAGCTSSPTSISDETLQQARAEGEEQKARQIHDEYWQAQMEREEQMRAARERAQEQARQRRARK